MKHLSCPRFFMNSGGVWCMNVHGPFAQRAESLRRVSMRILVIEDYPKLAQTIKKGLMAQGYAVDVCERGHEGEAQACSTNYDVIVLDLMLPDRDGLDVCRNLRRRKIATP